MATVKKKPTKRVSQKKIAARARNIERILVPVDLQEQSSWRAVLPVAIDYARAMGAELRLVTVIPEIDYALPAVRLPKNFNKARIEEATTRLEAFVDEHLPGDVTAGFTVRDGNIYREILDEADDYDADLIVMASHRPSLRSYLLGVNAARVVRHAKCSVYVIREPS